MTPAMNRVLRRHFGRSGAAWEHGSAGLCSPRVRFPPTASSSYPLRAYDEDLDLWVCAHGGAFAGSSIDLGTRFLIGCFDRLPPTARHVVDLGCGTGVLAVAAARQRPEAEVPGRR